MLFSTRITYSAPGFPDGSMRHCYNVNDTSVTPGLLEGACGIVMASVRLTQQLDPMTLAGVEEAADATWFHPP